MSTKTNFKRIALAVVASLGISLLASGPSANGAIVNETLTLGAATATVTAGDTATTTLTTTFTPTVLQDSVTVLTSCYASVPGVSCPTLQHFWSPTADSSTVTQLRSYAGASANPQVAWLRDSFSVSSTTAGAAVSATTNIKVVTTTSTTAATYTYTIYTATSAAGATAAATSSNLSRTFAVTVNALNTTVTGIRTYVGYSDAQSGWYYNQATRGNGMVASSDSAVAVSGGTATSTNLTAAAYVNVLLLNSASETRTAVGNVNICADTCTITAILSGTAGGVLATGNAASIARTAGTKSVSMSLHNLQAGLGAATDDTLTVYGDGGAGTATVTFYSGSLSLGSVSVIFTGTAASANIALFDTTTSVGQLGDSISAIIKDAGGNALTSATVYVYSSDTKVVGGALSTDAAQFTQRAAGLAGAAPSCTTYNTTVAAFTCGITFLDTGTATITLRDSWTVAASTWVSNEVTVTVLGNSAKSFTVAFDKATYAPGERAVITITGLDTAGRAVSNGVTGAGLSISNTVTPSLGANQVKGTNGTQDPSTNTFKGYVAPFGVETGVETRVVTMPTYATDVTFDLSYTPALSTTAVVASGKAKVVNPQDGLIALAQAAADAAADAAAEAIDAANAATDAANLAAEAADAATVAAEEARDAADAATAAVEELATQVATLMAALKAQITTLANTVAKIAKKVKA